jgi:predicted nuclease with TOPRIM domain
MAGRRGKNGGPPGDPTLDVLKQIRDEIRELRHDTNARFGEVNERLDETNARLDRTNERLDRTNERLDGTNGRLDVQAQALVKLIGEVRGLNDRFDNFLAGAHRHDHEELAARVGKLEDAVFRRTG